MSGQSFQPYILKDLSSFLLMLFHGTAASQLVGFGRGLRKTSSHNCLPGCSRPFGGMNRTNQANYWRFREVLQDVVSTPGGSGLSKQGNGHKLTPMKNLFKPPSKRLNWRGVVATGLLLSALATAAVEIETISEPHYSMRNWDLDEGLPSTCVNTCAKTADGYLWLGTRNGLTRFDGFQFVNYTKENCPALKRNIITSLAVNRDGALWIATEWGNLVKMNHGVFENVDLGKVALHGTIKAMAFDAEGSLWLGTLGDGIIRLSNGRATVFTPSLGLPSQDILQLLPDFQNRLWFVTRTGELGWIEAEKCHCLKLSGTLPQSVQAIALARDGGIWAAADMESGMGTRIYKIKNGVAREESRDYPWPQDSKRTQTGALLEDQTGILWCGTTGAGVYYLSANGQWLAVSANKAMSQLEVTCLLNDEGEKVWIGTRSSGINLLSPQAVSAFPLPMEYGRAKVTTVCIRHDGTAWGGTEGSGIFRWHHDQCLRFGKTGGLASLHVNVLMEDSHSNLWSGTSRGLFRLAGEKFQLITNPSLASAASIGALFEDRHGNLWAGTDHGLITVAGDHLPMEIPDAGLPAGQIAALAQDLHGQFWVTISGCGVFHQAGDRFEPFFPKNLEHLAALNFKQNIRSILCDREGLIWFATYGGGLFCKDDERFRNWLWDKPLPSNHLFCVLDDDRGNLWVSSENGIFCLSKTALLGYAGPDSPNPISIKLSDGDGLITKVCSGGGEPQGTKSHDGRYWFPDGPGVVAIEPAHLAGQFRAKEPVIEDLRVDGLPIPALPNLPLKIMSGPRSFEFHYTSPNFSSPTSLRFRYRLDGLDGKWAPEGIERSVRYGRLTPGNYTFRVMARNNIGNWNEKEATFEFIILQTRWFQVLTGLLLLSFFGLAILRMEKARNRRKLAALETQRTLERERARIARDIHDDLGASLSRLALLSDMVRHSDGNSAEWRVQTQQVSSAAHDMARSLEAIVWAVRPENDSLRRLVQYMSRRTDEIFENIPRHYRFEASQELPDPPVYAEVRHNVFLAYKEALTNTLKHARTTNVLVKIEGDQTSCRITIADDGCGFNPENIRTGGTGLKNMRQRMEEIGGKFELQTTPGRGTTVQLGFPLNRTK